MTRPQRHLESTVKFKDPLSNFDAPGPSDPLQRALAQEPVSAIISKPVTTVDPDTSIEDAMKLMDAVEISCVLVTADDRLVGVFTERDVLYKVADRYHQIKDQAVSQVMTRDPIIVYETDSAATALCVIAVSGIRHVPVLDVDGRLVGVVSPRRVTGFLQDHFTAETGCCN